MHTSNNTTNRTQRIIAHICSIQAQHITFVDNIFQSCFFAIASNTSHHARTVRRRNIRFLNGQILYNGSSINDTEKAAELSICINTANAKFITIKYTLKTNGRIGSHRSPRIGRSHLMPINVVFAIFIQRNISN